VNLKCNVNAEENKETIQNCTLYSLTACLDSVAEVKERVGERIREAK